MNTTGSHTNSRIVQDDIEREKLLAKTVAVASTYLDEIDERPAATDYLPKELLALPTESAGAEAALEAVALPAWFDELLAVRDGEFFAVDGKGLFARPGPRLVEGIAVLAELCYPEIFAGAGPIEAWRPLAPIGIAGDRLADGDAGQP